MKLTGAIATFSWAHRGAEGEGSFIRLANRRLVACPFGADKTIRVAKNGGCEVLGRPIGHRSSQQALARGSARQEPDEWAVSPASNKAQTREELEAIVLGCAPRGIVRASRAHDLWTFGPGFSCRPFKAQKMRV